MAEELVKLESRGTREIRLLEGRHRALFYWKFSASPTCPSIRLL
jgi:hypothetical protein